jgi:hypothetical protein
MPNLGAGSGGSHFLTSQESYARAQRMLSLSKDAARTHEIQPYASSESGDVAALDLAPGAAQRAAADVQRDRRLRFGPDGEVIVEAVRGTKRDGGADVDLDEINPAPRPPVQTSRLRAPDTADFPPVFTSPPSQRELFAPPSAADKALMPPPPLPVSRETRTLPVRSRLNKAVSAPVGRLGWQAMDVDTPSLRAPIAAPFTSGFMSPSVSFAAPNEEDEEDGFDVSEWAEEEVEAQQ